MIKYLRRNTCHIKVTICSTYNLSRLKTHQFVLSSKNKQKYVYFLPVVGNIRKKYSGTWLNSSAVVTLHTIHTNTKSIRSL